MRLFHCLSIIRHGRLARWRKVKSLWRRKSERRVREWAVTYVKQRKGLEHELWRKWSNRKVVEWAELIDIEIYSTAHSPTFPSLHLHHNSFSNPSIAYLRHSLFSNPSVALPTSQFILQPFFRFSHVTSYSLNTPGEPPMERTIMAGEHTWYL